MMIASESHRPDINAPPLSAAARIGTAGWTIPAAIKPAFDNGGSQLERFASRLSAVEINSSFYRPHRRSTYERWAATVPPGFRFSVKLPRTISHAPTLVPDRELLVRFSDEIGGLGNKLGCVLIQFPPKRAFEGPGAERLFSAIQEVIDCPLVCEPRHATWGTQEAETFLSMHRIARVVADPVLFAGGDQPGGWTDMTYRRLHGSPQIYRSSYDEAALAALATSIESDVACCTDAWCIFDNTASGAATANAMSLVVRLNLRGSHREIC